MSPSSVQVPIVRPPSYAPAWAEKVPGVRVSRTLDVADLLADRGVGLVDVTVAADPPLQADDFYVSDKAVSFFLVDAPPATARLRSRVRFDLLFSDGSADEITVFQPIAAPAAPGLMPVTVPDVAIRASQFRFSDTTSASFSDGTVLLFTGSPAPAQVPAAAAKLAFIDGTIATFGDGTVIMFSA